MQAGVMKSGPLVEGLVPAGILRFGLGQITVLQPADPCAMLKEASL